MSETSEQFFQRAIARPGLTDADRQIIVAQLNAWRREILMDAIAVAKRETGWSSPPEVILSLLEHHPVATAAAPPPAPGAEDLSPSLSECIAKMLQLAPASRLRKVQISRIILVGTPEGLQVFLGEGSFPVGEWLAADKIGITLSPAAFHDAIRECIDAQAEPVHLPVPSVLVGRIWAESAPAPNAGWIDHLGVYLIPE